MRAVVAVPILLIMVLAGCGRSAEPPESTPEAPGTLAAQRSLENLDSSLSAAASSATYLRYRSTAPSGASIEVSGALFVPTGAAPPGGWPLISLAHGTSGVVSACAPTNSRTLFGSAPLVTQLLAGKRAVVMTNYQGLDGPGAAPYLDTPSSGYDVLNAARAAHATGLPLTQDIVIVGASQGGRAAESAAETAKSYAPELKIHGVLLLSPALELNLDEPVRTRTLNAPDQYLILPYIVEAIRYGDPAFTYDRVMHGDLLTAAPRLEASCTGDLTAADLELGKSATPAEAWFTDDAAAQRVADFEARTNLPKSATAFPTYIVRGDADPLVNSAWSDSAVAKMCALGTPVHDLVVPGGHEAPTAVAGQWLPWIGDLFADSPIVSTCPR